MLIRQGVKPILDRNLVTFGNALVTATIIETPYIDVISTKITLNLIDIVVFPKTVTLDILNSKFIDEYKSLQLKFNMFKTIMQINQ